jgi:phospholipase C
VHVPAWISSPWAKAGYLDPTLHEITSILNFLERLHGLPTLASVDHLFDEATPTGGNSQAAGGAWDDIGELGDLLNAFDS